ncbi:MAG: hypothetical protein ACR2OU_12380, partial [Thermomicrobiales bacterium]
MAHVPELRHRVHRFIPAFAISLLVLELFPAAAIHAQNARSLTIVTHQCPPGFVGDYPQQHCTQGTSGVQFTITIGDLATGNKKTIASGEDGSASLNLGDASAVSIKGPAFFISTTGSEPHPVLSVQCLGDNQQPIAGTGGNSGRTYTLAKVQGVRAITCNWYIGADTGPLSAWQGGYPDNKAGVYPGDFVSLYGAHSDFPAASVTFNRADVPQGMPGLQVTGLDDEWPQHEKIEVSLNGTVIYSGSSTFPNWYPGMR